VLGLLLFLGLSVTGNYVVTLLPGFLVVGVGAGAMFATVVIVATNGVSDEEQGLVSGLFNTTMQVGSGLILAVVVALSTVQTTQLLLAGAQTKVALTGGFLFAIIACAVFEAIAVAVTLFVIRERAVSRQVTVPLALEADREEELAHSAVRPPE
jgi:MFS family permease